MKAVPFVVGGCSLVRVFDLARTDWHATMTADQLESFRRRLQRLGNPERNRVTRFMEEEIKRKSLRRVDRGPDR
jgi:hypothetical protein